MRCTVQLQTQSHGVPGNLPGPVELIASLYYESGIRVEENDQKILRVRCGNSVQDKETYGDGLLIIPKTGEAQVEFRIEKVSRRKDNQNFMLQLKIAPGVRGADAIDPVFSPPITVLSKRKIPAALRDNPEGIVAHKAALREQNNQSRRVHSHSTTTPEMRPQTSRKRKRNDSANSGSKKTNLGKILATNNADASLQGMVVVPTEMLDKVEDMSRTVGKIFDMMQDQRMQIQKLQEQVKQLRDSSENPSMRSSQPISGETGLSVLNMLPSQPSTPKLVTRLLSRDLQFDFGSPASPLATSLPSLYI